MKTVKIFVGVRFPPEVLEEIKQALLADPEEDLSSFVRRAVRRELAQKYLSVNCLTTSALRRKRA